MLTVGEVLSITKQLETILSGPAALREARIEALAGWIEDRHGRTPEGRLIALGVRSWAEAPGKVGEAG